MEDRTLTTKVIIDAEQWRNRELVTFRAGSDDPHMFRQAQLIYWTTFAFERKLLTVYEFTSERPVGVSDFNQFNAVAIN